MQRFVSCLIILCGPEVRYVRPIYFDKQIVLFILLIPENDYLVSAQRLNNSDI